jgi:outer membrane protein assembly factor BamB
MQMWGSSAESEATPAGGSLFYFGSSDLRRISLMDAADGRVLWRTDVYGWAWARPIVHGNLLLASTVGANPYQMRHLGALTAIDRSTGKIAWRWPMPELPGQWAYGFVAPAAVDDTHIVVGGLDGSLYGFPVK